MKPEEMYHYLSPTALAAGLVPLGLLLLAWTYGPRAQKKATD